MLHLTACRDRLIHDLSHVSRCFMLGPSFFTDNLIRRYGEGVQICAVEPQCVTDMKLCSSKPQKGNRFQVNVYRFQSSMNTEIDDVRKASQKTDEERQDNNNGVQAASDVWNVTVSFNRLIRLRQRLVHIFWFSLSSSVKTCC